MRVVFVPLVIVIGLLFNESYQQSLTTNETHYIAAVVEFNSYYQPGVSRDELVSNNSEAYQEIITSKSAELADIIVFPESTLNGVLSTYVPKAEDQISPCDKPQGFDKYLVDISCKAKEARKYVVINLTSKENCTKESQEAINDPRPCALNGLSTFNTNVVFDRTGAVISTYRKVHLFGEYGKNVTYTPDISTFTTDFNVTFGHFVCFDILFQSPALDLVGKGITDIIYPTMWFSELPFLTAVQSQMAWAYANDVNLLAANSGFPAVGSTGTGIYAGRSGLLTAVNHEVPVREVYVAAVPKVIKGKRANTSMISPRGINSTNDMFILRDNSMDKYVTKLVSSSINSTQKFQVCSNSFCCYFKVTKQNKASDERKIAYKFRVGTFNGYRSFQDVDRTYLRTCGLFACSNSSLNSCGVTFNTKETGFPVTDVFEHIEITAKYPKTQTMLIQPTGVHRNLLPVPVDEFKFDVRESGDLYEVTLTTWNRTDLLSFGVFTNYYENSSGSLISSLFVVFISYFCSRLQLIHMF